MFQTLNKSQIFVSLEKSRILGEDMLELVHISLFNTVHYLKIGSKMFLEVLLSKDRPLRNLSHQQLNYH